MTDLTPDRLQELSRIAEAATPGLRLTPEKYEQLRGLAEAVEHGTAPFITYEADLAARAFREIERLRREHEVLAAAVRAWKKWNEALGTWEGFELIPPTRKALREALALIEGGGRE